MKRQLVGLIVLLTFFAGLITIICVNSKYIFRTEPYYSETEVDQMCKDAYQQSIKDNSDIALYNKMSELTIKNLELISKNESLFAENEILKSDNLLKEKNISDNETLIEKLNSQILKLEENKSANETLIAELREQVNNLDKQNKLLAYEISENEILIEENNKTISQLQNSIAYYEEYIQGLETEDEVFAIFVVENEIFNIQKLNKNGLAYLESLPTFAENATFNGWTVNDKIVDLTTYTLSCNTTFVADLTYAYTVNFMVDNELFNSQTIIENGFATVPASPTKDGYVFDGWSLNNVDLVENIENQSVSRNLTYNAIFTRAFNVSFVINNEIVDTQQVKVGSTAQNFEIESNQYNVFNGWTLNGLIVNVDNYLVYEDLIFVADITYFYDVKFFVDDSTYNSQLIEKDCFVVLPDEPTKTDELFIGWSINGTDIVSDINSIAVSENVSYIALFETITVTQEVSYNNEVIGNIVVSANRTVITMNKGWELDYATIKISLNSRNYTRTSITNTFVNNDFIQVISNSVKYVNGSAAGNTGLKYSCVLNSLGQLVYSISIGGNSVDLSLNTANNYSIVTYAYFYTLYSDSSLTNLISSMTQCVDTETALDTSLSINLYSDDSNIIGWAIYVDDPNFDRTEMSNILSTDLFYIGDSGTSVDLSAYRKYSQIKLFAVYKV